MSIKSFIQGFGTKKTPEPNRPAGYLSFAENRYLADINLETYLRSYKSWVYAAVTKRADSFATLKLTLNKIVKKGGENVVEPVKDHPILELLDRVNPYLSFPDLLKIYQTYKDLAGNAYWWLIKDGNKITEIWPYLRPDRMSAIPSAENFIAGYNYLVPDRGEYVKFLPDEIIHFQYPNPMDPYRGASPMEACYLAFNTYIKSSEFNNRFFQNNARADFLLTFPNGLTDVEQKQIRAQWETRHKGEGHEHRFGILSGDAKVLNVGMSPKDMEFIEQMKFTRDEILAIFKVPKALLDPQELNFASAKTAKEVFMEEVVVPLMKDFVCSLNEFLLPFYGDDSLFFDFISPLEENPETKYTRYQTLASVGAIAPNEIRAEEGLPPFEGGNSVYLSAMMTPIGEEVDMNQGKMLVGKIDKVELPQERNVLVRSKSLVAELREGIKKDIQRKIDEKSLAKKKIILPPEVKKKTDRQIYGEMVWNAKITKTNEDERIMKKLLSNEFNRQQKEVLASLHEKSFTFKFDTEGETGIFVKVFTPFFANLIKRYGEDALNMIDLSGFDLNSQVKDWLKKAVFKFSGEVNQTTQDKIRAALSKSVEAGESIPDAGKRIREVFAEASVSRSKMIARTEITNATNYSNEAAWDQSGVVQGKEWLTAIDERTCDECVALDGKVVGLGESFGEVDNPALHPNCRCDTLAVLKTKSAIYTELKNEKDELIKATEDIKIRGEREINEVKEIKDKLNKVLEDGQN